MILRGGEKKTYLSKTVEEDENENKNEEFFKTISSGKKILQKKFC